MDLAERGWKQIDPDPPGTVPRVQSWRLGWEPFCVELEIWEKGEIRGRLCAPGLKVYGNMVFESLRSVPDAVDFLEKLLDGATHALPQEPQPEAEGEDNGQ